MLRAAARLIGNPPGSGFVAEAVRAIAANRNRPFFLYLALNSPLQALRADYEALP